MRFRPCIDLHQGRVKQIVGSTYSDTADREIRVNFESGRGSSWYARLYREHGLSGGHVIMLGPGNEQAALEAFSAYKGGMQAGGGITPENAGVYLDAGASHVIVTSFVFQNGRIRWENLEAMRAAAGRDRLVLDISCRMKNGTYYIVTDRWQKYTDYEISPANARKLEAYCNEFLVHAVDVEGKMSGIDTELVRLLAEACSIPVTYAGGITSLSELDTIDALGKGRIDASIGSALDIFGGSLPFTKVAAWDRKHRDRPGYF